jgi:hypothetical protein
VSCFVSAPSLRRIVSGIAPLVHQSEVSLLEGLLVSKGEHQGVRRAGRSKACKGS